MTCGSTTSEPGSGTGGTGGTSAIGGAGASANLGGPAITVDFSATDFTDSQCDDLFNSLTPSGEGGQGGGGAGAPGSAAGRSGGTVATGPMSASCVDYAAKASLFCGTTITSALLEEGSFAVGSTCYSPSASCADEFDALVACAATNIATSKCSKQEIAEEGYCEPQYEVYLECAP